MTSESDISGSLTVTDGAHNDLRIETSVDESFNLIVRGGSVNELTLAPAPNYSSVRIQAHFQGGSLSGEVKIEDGYAGGAVIWLTSPGSAYGVEEDLSIGAGTRFELSDATTLYFVDYTMTPLSWTLSVEDVARVLGGGTMVSGGTVQLSGDGPLTLNFENEAAFRAFSSGGEKALKIFDCAIEESSAEYGITWQVSVDGVERPDFKLDFDLASGVLEVIPEPSAFGLLVGALALALAVSRRRRA